MSSLELTWDSRDLSVWRGGKVESALLKALTKSGNDAARAMKAASGRSVRQRKRLKVARVNNGLPLLFPKASKDIGRLEWVMKIEGNAVPIADYPHSQTRKGVTVGVNNAGRKLIAGAFIATMRSGHRGVFVRAKSGAFGPMTKKQIKRSKSKLGFFRVARLPIEEVFTTRISDVFNDSGMVPAVQARTQSVFAASFGRLLPIELGKLTPQK